MQYGECITALVGNAVLLFRISSFCRSRAQGCGQFWAKFGLAGGNMKFKTKNEE
jgi:hypothetical protein